MIHDIEEQYNNNKASVDIVLALSKSGEMIRRKLILNKKNRDEQLTYHKHIHQ